MINNFFKKKNLSKEIKLRRKNTTIDKTLTYASDKWDTDRKRWKAIERF